MGTRGWHEGESVALPFQAAALAEFRADWATAVKTYQTAYSEVSKVGLGPPLAIQRAIEVAAVAEQVHVKVMAFPHPMSTDICRDTAPLAMQKLKVRHIYKPLGSR